MHKFYFTKSILVLIVFISLLFKSGYSQSQLPFDTSLHVKTPRFYNFIPLNSPHKIALLVDYKKPIFMQDSVHFADDSAHCFTRVEYEWVKKYKIFQLNQKTFDSTFVSKKEYPAADSSQFLVEYDTSVQKFKQNILEPIDDECFDTLYTWNANQIFVNNNHQFFVFDFHKGNNQLKFQTVQLLSYQNITYDSITQKQKIEQISFDSKLLNLIKFSDKWGVIDTSLHFVITPQFTKIVPLENQFFACYDSLGVHIYTSQGLLINKEKYDAVVCFKDAHFLIQKNNKKGLLSKLGKEVIAPQYQSIGWNVDSLQNKWFDKTGLTLVQHENGKYGVLNNKSKVILPCKFNEILPAKDNFIAANSSEIYGYHPDGVWGFYDYRTGKQVISPKYDALIHNFENGIAVTGHYVMMSIKPASLEIRQGLSDKRGNELTPFIYRSIKVLNNSVLAVQDSVFHWGFCDKNGRLLTKCLYDEFELIGKNIKVAKQGKFGLLDLNGREVYAPKYKEIRKIETGGFEVKDFHNYSLYHDSLGFAQLEFDEIFAAAPGLFVFGLNGYYGLINTEGKILLKNNFTFIDKFINGSSVVKINGKYGLINKSGAYLLQPEYDEMKKDSTGLIRIKGKEIHDYGHIKVVVSEYAKWGLADSVGHTILEFKHNEILAPSDSMYPVKRGEKWGFYNYKTDFIIPFQFSKINQVFNFGLAVVSIDSIKVLINKNGEILNTRKYDSLWVMGPHSVVFKRKNHYGLLAKNGLESLPACYQKITKVANLVFELTEQDSILSLCNAHGTVFYGDVKLKINGYWSGNVLIMPGDTSYTIFNTSGKQVLAPQPRLEHIDYFSDGYARMTYTGKFGFIDHNGKIRIASQYENTKHFQDGMCAIFLKNKWGFIDKAEHLWVQPYYDTVCAFQGKLAAVSYGKKWAFVNNVGKETTKFVYSNFIYQGNGFYAVERNKNWGMLSPEGEEFVFTKYDGVDMLGNKYVKIYSEGKYGTANLKGEIVVPIEFNKITYDSLNATIIAEKE